MTTDRPNPSRTRRTLTLVVASLVLGALSGAAVAPAQTVQDQISAKQRQLDATRAKKGVLTSSITHYTRKIAHLQGTVAALRTREDRVKVQLYGRQNDLNSAQTSLRLERTRLKLLRVRLKRSIKLLQARLVAIYKSNDPDIVSVVLSANGFADMVERTDFMRRIGEQDSKTIGRVRDLRTASRQAVTHLSTLEARARAARDQIETKRRELARTQGALRSRQVDLMGARGGKRRLLASTATHEQELEGDLHVLQSKVAAAINAGPSPGGTLPVGPIRGGGGGMIWPVNGPVTSPFCERRAWEACHPGIDIGVPSGTPVRAAKSGIVALASPTSGYGNYVCVNHGGGLSTCYAHLSSYAASVGASVSQGQVIAYSGCTGRCFGPHLHFEVRINGAVTNPMNYL